jgi:hypothetical protein
VPLELARTQVLLVVDYDHKTQRHCVRIVPQLVDALKGWTSSTRISPMLGVQEYGTAKHATEPLRGEQALVFVGPLDPLQIPSPTISNAKLWLTLGAYNLVLLYPSVQAAKELVAWAETTNARYEHWTLVDGEVTVTAFHHHSDPATLLP